MKFSISHISLLLLLSILYIDVHNELMAQTTNFQRLISVSGEGEVTTVPDMATVRFGIVTRDNDPEEARRINAATARDAMNAIREMGIAESKLRLQTLRLQPVREYDPQTRKQVDKGYEASRELVVLVEDLDQLPLMISQLVQKGANRLNGISYGLKESEKAKDLALSKAVMRAKQKASLMAASLDVEVGEVLQIQEQNDGFTVPVVSADTRPQLMMAKSEAAAPEPEAYAAGEIIVKALVRVTFDIK